MKSETSKSRALIHINFHLNLAREYMARCQEKRAASDRYLMKPFVRLRIRILKQLDMAPEHAKTQTT
jgi:hypothetical protein